MIFECTPFIQKVILSGDRRSSKGSSMFDGEEMKNASQPTDVVTNNENIEEVAGGDDIEEESDVKDATPPQVNVAPPPIPPPAPQHVTTDSEKHITNESHLKTERTNSDRNEELETVQLPTNPVEEPEPAGSGCKCCTVS